MKLTNKSQFTTACEVVSQMLWGKLREIASLKKRISKFKPPQVETAEVSYKEYIKNKNEI